MAKTKPQPAATPVQESKPAETLIEKVQHGIENLVDAVTGTGDDSKQETKPTPVADFKGHPKFAKFN